MACALSSDTERRSFALLPTFSEIVVCTMTTAMCTLPPSLESLTELIAAIPTQVPLDEMEKDQSGVLWNELMSNLVCDTPLTYVNK